jgi:hypothetical protein
MSDQYNYDLHQILRELRSNGYSFLPSIKHIVESNYIYERFVDENISSTYTSRSQAQMELVNQLNLERLFVELRLHCEEVTGKKVLENDRYFISRHVKPGQMSEGYRGHFDSHFITIVLPVKIPVMSHAGQAGQLIVQAKARRHPKSEIENIVGKLLWKKYNNEKEYDRLLKSRKAIEVDFQDYRPLVFIGNTTFHGNRPLIGSQESRLSMLCHLYDTNPRFGIGAVLRKIRRR